MRKNRRLPAAAPLRSLPAGRTSRLPLHGRNNFSAGRNLLRSLRGNHLDPALVDLLLSHAAPINEERLRAQAEARRFAAELRQACGNPAPVRDGARPSLP